MVDLEEGLYMVRRKLYMSDGISEWEPAKYNVGLWHFISDTDEYTNADIAEIGERIIIVERKQPPSTSNIINDKCEHPKFSVKARVEKEFDTNSVNSSLIMFSNNTKPKHFLKVSTQCSGCGAAFQFVNLQTSIDLTELRIEIKPKQTQKISLGRIQ